MRVLLLTIMPDPDVRIPLGLATMKAFAHQHADLREQVQIEVRILNPSSANRMAEVISEVQPDLIGYSTFIWNARYVPYVIATAQKIVPAATIVLGGPSADFVDTKLLRRHQGVDIVVHGEGEKVFVDILRHYLTGTPALGDIQGMSYRVGNDIINTGMVPPMHDLDEIPSIYTSGLVPEFEASYDEVLYATSRGCSQKCSYCLWDNAGRNTFKLFSMKRILDDLRFLIAKGVNKIYFIDAFINFSHKRTIELFEFFLEHGRNTQFFIEIYGDMLNEREIELMNQLAEAGILARVAVGLQSMHADILKNVSRRLSGIL